jgi:hypothetical protein
MNFEILELMALDKSPGIINTFKLPTRSEWDYCKERSVVIICYTAFDKKEIELIRKTFPKVRDGKRVYWIHPAQPVYKLRDKGWEAYLDYERAKYIMWPASGSSIISARAYEFTKGGIREVESRRKTMNKDVTAADKIFATIVMILFATPFIAVLLWVLKGALQIELSHC